jgi:hypothetical protein
MIPDPADPGLEGRLPRVRRAREYRLYDDRGRRYLDLWQLDGHAVLGHRPAGASTAMKGVLSRGLAQDLPSAAAARVERALRALLPGHPFVRVYRTLDRCLEALSAACGRPIRVADLVDPVGAALGDPAGAASGTDAEVAVWRPFLPWPAYARARALVPVLPFQVCGGPWALCFRENPAVGVPPSEHVSPVVLEGVARGCAGIARHSPGPLVAALTRAGSPSWKVAGVYVTPRFPRDRYPEVFEAFLAAGAVLSPRYECPSVLPAEVSEGEIAMALGLFRDIPSQ